MCHLNWIIVAQSVMSQIHKKIQSSHFLEELLYVCARADLLREGVEHVEGEVWRLDLVVLWRKQGDAVTGSGPKRTPVGVWPFHWGGPDPWEPGRSLSPSSLTRRFVWCWRSKTVMSHGDSVQQRNDLTSGASSYPLTGIFPFTFVRKHIFIQLDENKQNESREEGKRSKKTNSCVWV